MLSKVLDSFLASQSGPAHELLQLLNLVDVQFFKAQHLSHYVVGLLCLLEHVRYLIEETLVLLKVLRFVLHFHLLFQHRRIIIQSDSAWVITEFYNIYVKKVYLRESKI